MVFPLHFCGNNCNDCGLELWLNDVHSLLTSSTALLLTGDSSIFNIFSEKNKNSPSVHCFSPSPTEHRYIKFISSYELLRSKNNRDIISYFTFRYCLSNCKSLGVDRNRMAVRRNIIHRQRRRGCGTLSGENGYRLTITVLTHR